MTTTTTTTTLTASPFTMAAGAAALGSIVEGVVALVHPVGDDNWDAGAQVLNLSFVLACVGMALALPYVGRWLHVGRAGRIGIVLAQAGCAAMVVESIVSSIHGGNILSPVFFVGLLATLLGLITVAVSGVVARQVWWGGPLLAVAFLVSIGGGEVGGSILLGLVWLTLALAVNRPQAR